jgi:hypothetical protein
MLKPTPHALRSRQVTFVLRRFKFFANPAIHRIGTRLVDRKALAHAVHSFPGRKAPIVEEAAFVLVNEEKATPGPHQHDQHDSGLESANEPR